MASAEGRSTISNHGMAVSDAAKLRAATDGNAKLKRILANSMLDNIVLKNLLGNN